jgi:hypothetical protein
MDPALLQQIAGGGSVQDQDRQINEQLQDLILRRRNRVASRYGTPGGALLGGIGDMIAAYKSRSAEEDLRNQRAGVQKQLGDTRSKFADAILGLQQPPQAPPDMIAAPGMDQAAQERAQQQQLMQMGTLGALSGDPLMAQAGESASRMPGQQLAMALQRQHLASGQQEMEQRGPQAALGGQTPGVYGLLTKRAEVPKFAPNPVSGRLYDVRTGQETGGASGGELTDKRLPAMQAALAKDLDPNNFRSGVLKGNQERSNAADRLLALAVDPLTGGPANLTPQQMSEVSSSLATLVGGGSSGEGTRHELTPYTKGRTIAQVLQWVTDNPHGAEQQGFVKQMIDTAKREQGVAQGQIRQAQGQRLPGHLPYFGLFPDAAKSQLSGFGFDPSEVDFKTGKYSPKAQAAAAAQAPALSPQDSAALQWAKSHPDDPRAQKILQLNGAH